MDLKLALNMPLQSVAYNGLEKNYTIIPSLPLTLSIHVEKCLTLV